MNRFRKWLYKPKAVWNFDPLSEHVKSPKQSNSVDADGRGTAKSECQSVGSLPKHYVAERKEVDHEHNQPKDTAQRYTGLAIQELTFSSAAPQQIVGNMGFAVQRV
ncbi:hypothetical protein AMECASPLE_022185 [Ameca splendens]|uniref:Uncharacterized protein n=1 Tax=Ameca splendens TaxID=208324 RepID=A0ABV0XGT0_9TELE